MAKTQESNTPTGSVMVVGAGIAGVQAALDLANSGYYVYLVEKSPAIGGTMAQLDKTFPTNDCSMCILSPKMNEVSMHPQIVLHTCTRVTSLEGKPGRYRLGAQGCAPCPPRPRTNLRAASSGTSEKPQ